MVKILLIIKNAFFRNFLSILGLSSVCFIFEACYGVPKNNFEPGKLTFTGSLLSVDSSKPIKYIKVVLTELGNANRQITATSDFPGTYTVQTDYINNFNYKLTATDTDVAKNGEFHLKDTTINVTTEDINKHVIIADIKLDRK